MMFWKSNFRTAKLFVLDQKQLFTNQFHYGILNSEPCSKPSIGNSEVLNIIFYFQRWIGQQGQTAGLVQPPRRGLCSDSFSAPQVRPVSFGSSQNKARSQKGLRRGNETTRPRTTGGDAQGVRVSNKLWGWKKRLFNSDLFMYI